MNVQDLLDSKGIFYKTASADYVIRCLSSDHEDTHPSLRIDKISGIMHCLSCGFKGNIFSYYGIKVSKVDVAIGRLKDKIKSILHKNPILPKGATPFEVDYRGISAETFKQFGAFTHSTRPEFVDRVVFPITDINDEVIAFQGRYIHSDADPKYLFEPRKVSPGIFPQKVEAIQGSIILVEGIFDLLNLYDKGLTNAVTGFGVNIGLENPNRPRNKERVKKILDQFASYKLQGVSKIYVMFDGDEPGRKGSKGIKRLLLPHFLIEEIEIADNEDPAQFTKERVEKLKELLYEHSAS